MRIITLLAACLAISACAPVVPNAFKGPNGKDAYSMQCSGFGRTMEDCLKKAGEVCPNGYTIVDRGSSVVSVPMNGSFMMSPQESLAVECK